MIDLIRKMEEVETDIGTVDTVVDGIQTDLSNATDGLGALKTLIDACNTTTPPTVAAIRAEMEKAGTKLTLALEDTADLQANQGAWATAAGFSTHSAADVKTAIEAVGSKLTLVLEDTADLQGNQAAWATAAGFSTHSAADVKTAVEQAGSSIAQILTDTGTTLDDKIDRILTVTEIRRCTVAAVGASTTKFISSLAEPEGDYWDRMAVLFTSGNNDGQMRRIKNYNGTTKEITVQTPLDTAPANGDAFVVPVMRAFLTADIEDIADAFWDETASEHVANGSFGKLMKQIKNAIDAVIGMVS